MKKQRAIARWAGLAAVSAALAGFSFACSDDEPTATPDTDAGVDSGTTPTQDASSNVDSAPPRHVAVAPIRPTSDASTVMGSATFTEEDGEVTVVVNIANGFPPGEPGPHGIHIHQNGSCDATDAGPGTAAGGHWNPNDAGHGLPDGAVHHFGDMGNVIIDDAGAGTLTLRSNLWRVQGDGENSIVGKAVIYHAQPDDGVSQPVGNAGARPGCGIITRQ